MRLSDPSPSPAIQRLALALLLCCSAAASAQETRMLLVEPATFREKQIAWHVQLGYVLTYRLVLETRLATISLPVQQVACDQQLVVNMACKRLLDKESGRPEWSTFAKDSKVTVLVGSNKTPATDAVLSWTKTERLPAAGLAVRVTHKRCASQLEVSVAGPAERPDAARLLAQLVDLPKRAFQEGKEELVEALHAAADMTGKRTVLTSSSAILFSTDGCIAWSPGAWTCRSEGPLHGKIRDIACLFKDVSARSSYRDDTDGTATDSNCGHELYTPWREYGRDVLARHGDRKIDGEQGKDGSGRGERATCSFAEGIAPFLYPYYWRGTRLGEGLQLEIVCPAIFRLGPADWTVIRSSPKLKCVAIRGVGVADATVRDLADHDPGLQEIILVTNGLSDAGIGYLTLLHGLRKVTLSSEPDGAQPGEFQVTPTGIRLLKNLPALDTLILGGAYASDAVIVPLSELSRLRSVAIAGGDVSPAGLDVLLQNKSITRIGLSRNRESLDQHLGTLAEWTRLLDGEFSVWQRKSVE